VTEPVAFLGAFWRRNHKLGLSLLLSFSATFLLLLPFCNLMYGCGCKPLWAGGVDSCNLHQADVPLCPWCATSDPVVAASPFILILIGQSVSLTYFHRKRNATFGALLLVGLLTFVLLGALHGYVLKMNLEYPYYFFRGTP